MSVNVIYSFMDYNNPCSNILRYVLLLLTLSFFKLKKLKLGEFAQLSHDHKMKKQQNEYLNSDSLTSESTILTTTLYCFFIKKLVQLDGLISTIQRKQALPLFILNNGTIISPLCLAQNNKVISHLPLIHTSCLITCQYPQILPLQQQLVPLSLLSYNFKT